MKDDEILTELKGVVTPVLDKVEREVDSDRAAFVIAAKELHTEKGEYAGIQTFIDICGDYGIIGEAMYNELLEQVEQGKPEFFNMLRALVKTLEEELEITDDDDEPLPENRTLH